MNERGFTVSDVMLYNKRTCFVRTKRGDQRIGHVTFHLGIWGLYVKINGVTFKDVRFIKLWQ